MLPNSNLLVSRIWDFCKRSIADVHWLKIDKAPALMEWETAWAGHSANQVCEKQPQIFMPSLLVNENIAVLAAYKSHRIIAGAIAFRNYDVIGLTNLFLPTDDTENFLADCIFLVMDLFEGLPIVGYEAGQRIALLQGQGFESIGSLRVWNRQSELG